MMIMIDTPLVKDHECCPKCGKEGCTCDPETCDCKPIDNPQSDIHQKELVHDFEE